MKKVISILLVIALVITMLPTMAFAASKNYIEVVKDNAPLRSKGDGDASISLRCDAGTILETTGTYFNWRKLSNWYKVRVPGSEDIRYIYAGNVENHVHKVITLDVNGIEYMVCKCGDISAKTTNQKDWEEANTVLRSTTLALPLVAADGFLPIGDVAAAIIVIVGVCVAHDYTIPDAKELAAMVTEADFDKYFEERETNSCSRYSFRRVSTFPGGLKYLDKYCMDAAEAFVYISLVHGNVYTEDENSAMMLASMFSSAIMERDKASPKKDITTYFYHYHVGTDRVNKAHIFFGLNDRKEGPV